MTKMIQTITRNSKVEAIELDLANSHDSAIWHRFFNRQFTNDHRWFNFEKQSLVEFSVDRNFKGELINYKFELVDCNPFDAWYIVSGSAFCDFMND